jgi:hypothetical protein
LRAEASIAASTSSFTALAFAPGAFEHRDAPGRLASSTGMLFTPAPARPIAFTEGAISAGVSACERSRSASGSESALPHRVRRGRKALEPARRDGVVDRDAERHVRGP